MNKWIYFTVFILLHISPAILGEVRILEITESEKDGKIPVWINDNVTIVAKEIPVLKWFFNNATIAELNVTSGNYTYPNASSLFNITAIIEAADSTLTLGNVNHIYTGTYEAFEKPSSYSLSMIVHDVNIYLVDFNLASDLDSCRAYLQINDSISPSNDSIIYRTVNSSYLTVTPTNLSNATSFEINDSRLNITDNSTNPEINIQYTFAYNNFSVLKSNNISFDASLIKQPNITVDGTPGNCTILIQHNTSVACVRNITYCFNTNNTEPKCNFSINLNNLTLEYPWNSTSANLSIVYDIIYTKYSFDINITQCTTEAITSVEPTTMNSAPPEITTIQSGTNDTTTSGDMTNYSGSIYSSMSPSTLSTYLDTVTSSSITATSELSNTTLSPTMNATVVPNDPEYFATWKIVLIAVGSVIGIVLLGGGIGYLLCKKKSTNPYSNGRSRTTKIKPIELEVPSAAQSSSNEHAVQRSIPQSKPTNRLQVQYDQRQPLPPTTLFTSPERTDRQPQSSSHNQTIRPTIPPPVSKSYAPSSRQEPRTNYEQFSYSPASQSVLTPPNRIHQQQVPNDQRRRLPLISDV